METPGTQLRLFEKQADALESRVPELLVGGDLGPCGLSHLLRVAGIVLAAENEGLQVVLARFDAGDLRRDQLEGRNGIIAIVSDMQRHGACVVTPTEVRFVGGGVLHWTGLKRETEVRRVLEKRCDVLLVDDVEEVPEAIYERLQNHVLNGAGFFRRTVAASNSLGSAGWVDHHWNGLTVPGRGFIPMSPRDIAPGLVDLPKAPSYRDFIDSVQPGWMWPPHVELVVDAVDQWINGAWEHIAIFMPSQHSKHLALDTPLRTPSGWTTMGEIRVGDEIFAVDGTRTRVTFKTEPVEKTVYEVSTDDGFTVECSESHEWVVRLDIRRSWRRKTTAYLHQRPAGARNPHLHIHGPLKTKFLRPCLPVDPWVLGFWLGDGNSNSGRITVGDQDLGWVLGRFAEHYPTKIRRGNGKRAPCLGTRGLTTDLRTLQLLGNKHIPSSYLNATPTQRLELLCGLIDSDGSVAKDGQVQYTGVNKRLVMGVRELIVGLGMKASMITGRSILNGRDYGPMYTVLFYGCDVAMLPRKAARLKKTVKKVHRYLTVRRRERTALMQCIQVDHPSHQYLCGYGLLPTHNTECGPRNAIPHILRRYPTDWCAIASWGSELANSRSADARENFLNAGGELKEGRRRINEWLTRQGGGCWSAGAAAGQAGRSATWIFLDDPDKDWADAINKTQQGKKQRRYGSVWRSRESMFAADQREQKQCITATRWDPGDLAGYALKKGQEAGEKWGIVVLPALYDPKVADDYQEMYPDATVMEDFRTELNEPLWPERRNQDKWARVRGLLGPVIFLTECQQNAQGVVQGGKFWSEWFVRIDRDPAWATETPNEAIYVECCRAWDLAGTAGGGDYTAGSKLGILENAHVIVRHVVRDQLSTGGVKQLIAATMILDGPEVVIRVPIDPASGGIAAATEIDEFLRLTAVRVGMRLPEIVMERPRRMAHGTLTAKAARATDLISFAQPGDWQEGRTPRIPGGVSFIGERWAPSVKDRIGERYAEIAKAWPVLTAIAEHGSTIGSDWQTPWLHEMQSFTGEDGREDDQVDATVDGFDQIRYHEEPYSAVIRR